MEQLGKKLSRHTKRHKAAFAIWDTFGAPGENKNYQFQPLVYPNPLLSCGIPSLGKLPPSLDTIMPAVEGVKFRRAP
jgi:hypothetical protein